MTWDSLVLSGQRIVSWAIIVVFVLVGLVVAVVRSDAGNVEMTPTCTQNTPCPDRGAGR